MVQDRGQDLMEIQQLSRGRDNGSVSLGDTTIAYLGIGLLPPLLDHRREETFAAAEWTILSDFPHLVRSVALRRRAVCIARYPVPVVTTITVLVNESVVVEALRLTQ